MQALFLRITSTLCLLPLAACTIHPLLTRGGDAWLGGSLMTRAAHEQARIAKADGTTLEYQRDNGDETAVPHDYLRYKMISQAIGASRSVLNTAVTSSARATTTAGQASPAIVGGVVGTGISALSGSKAKDTAPKAAAPAF